MTLQGIAAGSRANGSSLGYGSLGRGHINTLSKEQAQAKHDAIKAQQKAFLRGDYSSVSN